ncbi:MAG TPA: nucleotidyltransferase family protein [Pyrinomonadaceae bacterium]|nr:nucleotidyltransferase family protein [Pyrinomonadaceae bacterium]
MKLAETEKEKIIEICKRNDISYCALFGSFARGEADETSDIDLLVKFSRPVGWKFYGIAEDLQEILGRNVDLATEPMLNRYIRANVLRDLQVIYEKAD